MKNEKEVDDFNRECREKQEKRAEERSFYERTKQQYTSGNLIPIRPYWHLKKSDLDLTKQDFTPSVEISSFGFEVIESVGVEALLNTMQDGNPALFRSKNLFHHCWDGIKISNVIRHWGNLEKLIPPTIIHNHLLNKLYVIDGKHRFHVAYYFDIDTIPIVIPASHKIQIVKLLEQYGAIK
jgi:hypothetical protein